MPANRSRTERWRDCLAQIYERNGGLEISVARSKSPRATLATPADHAAPAPDLAQDRMPELAPEIAPDLVWRVRILRLTDTEILIERPAAMGQSFGLAVDTTLVAVMSVGQNRWMFRTRVIGIERTGLRLEMPTTVERCRRRDFLRVSTAALTLPVVSCWPLLDPVSVIPAEIANREHILDLERRRIDTVLPIENDLEILPEVGPPFPARLMNLGGGGVGLLVAPGESAALDRSRTLWLHIDLRPTIPAPLALTTRVVHRHLDSEQNIYVGASFDFSAHAGHREFVVAQISRFLGVASDHRAAA